MACSPSNISYYDTIPPTKTKYNLQPHHSLGGWVFRRVAGAQSLTLNRLAGRFAATKSMNDDPSFWAEIKHRNRARVQSWISEQLDYLLMIAWLIVALMVFQVLQTKFPSDTMSLLVKMDHVTIVIVFGCFCFNTFRNAVFSVADRR